jgi:SAM-dependent methyltransferase
VTSTDYDRFAEAYSAQNDSGFFNAHYARPEMLRLAGDVSGRRILDAGCGSGPLSAVLLAKGAGVTGFDVSAAMVELARQRLGDDADVHVADLAAPLAFADAEFDDVVASLVLHYLEDWAVPLAEFRRVLKPGGRRTAEVAKHAEQGSAPVACSVRSACGIRTVRGRSGCCAHPDCLWQLRLTACRRRLSLRGTRALGGSVHPHEGTALSPGQTCAGVAAYSSSVTCSSQVTTSPWSSASWMATWAMNRPGVAPCQCSSPGSM